MLSKKIFGVLILSCFFVSAVQAQSTKDLKTYFSETATKVKAEPDPEQKREILDNSLQRMSMALNKLEVSGLVSKEDLAGLDGFRNAVQEKRDELAGANGFDPVPNAQLNSFADYVVQDMQQAERTVTISLLTALLILIIVILLV